jgi:nicotinamide-nucleotide amidase
MNIEVICTGDEVLTGKIVNTNYAYIAQKLEESGLAVQRGVTIGDDRKALLEAFLQAGERADAVIVNGGLGPTIDDLSQEMAARAVGVGLVLHEPWIEHMERFFRQRGRTMPANNRKQAMLPEGAELLDNPIGTACGFALRIGKARFYFTPGVPRELFKMLEEQILPRILSGGASPGVILLRRFHSFGLGESHVDQLLAGLEAMDPHASVKLGFRAHYPQLETKLTCRAPSRQEARARLAPIEAELLRRIGNFVLAEDDQTHEGVVLELMARAGATLAVAEDLTGGRIVLRLSALPDAARVLVRGAVALTGAAKRHEYGSDGGDSIWEGPPSGALAEALARAARERAGTSHALAVTGACEGEPRARTGHTTGTLHFALATPEGLAVRQAGFTGTPEWIALGGAEMGLDLIRRHLKRLPIDERIDFEKNPAAPGERAG